MSTETLLSQAVKGALAFGAAGTLVGAGSALAQTAAPASATAGTNLSKIVVTGSRIPKTSIATSQPVITINRQQIDATGFTTTGQLLQNLTSAGSALNVNFNNGGNGATFINLHGLGSARVLVLVDGQRWVSGLGGAVDLTTIPLSIIDRIEVLLDGASSVYGSEAIAGVINIITIKNFNGATASAYMGMYDGSKDGGGWDGKTQNYSFTVGTAGDRSSVLLSAGYYNQNQIWAGQRTISKEPNFGAGVASGSSNPVNGRYLFLSVGQIPNLSGCVTYIPGYLGVCDLAGPITGPNANPHPFTDADRFNFAPLNYLRTPSERYYLYSQGHYDLTDNVTFNFLAAFNQRNSHQVLAPNPWSLGLVGLQADGLPIGVSVSNPYNPFGVDMVPGYTSTSYGSAWCAKYGNNGVGGACTAQWDALILLGWRPLNAGNRDFQQNARTFYFRGGFEGYWMMAGNQWSWYANYIFSQSQNTIITDGLANTANMQKALGPVGACTGSSDGCVPLNMFGGQEGQTSQQIDYLLFEAHAISQSTVRSYNAGIAGSFWNSWYAGPWGVAAGYEYYVQAGYNHPDAIVSAGNTVGNVTQPTDGRVNTNAQYVELSIPFASNMFLAKELTLDIANRWSQFHWSGLGNILQPNGDVIVTAADGRATASTGRATLKWRPITQLLIRGSWSQGFRTPSLSELFFGASDSFPNLSDPCAPTSQNGGVGPGDPLPPGCGGVTHTQPNAQIKSAVGGNASLTPEKAISKSVGFVYSPSWAPGLDLAVDYYHVEVVNNIRSLGAQFFLNQCYVQNDPVACQHIVAPGAGNIVKQVVALQTNAGSQKVIGYDVQVDYKIPTTAVGDFGVHFNANFQRQDVGCGPSGCSDSTGTAFGSGFFGEPKHRMRLAFDWSYGPWGALWRINEVGQMWESCGAGFVPQSDGSGCSDPTKDVGGDNNVGQNHLGTTIYHDVQASYTVSSWNTTFTFGVLNLFDKSPPISHRAFANSYLPNFYRIPGRFFYGRVSVNF